MMGTGRSSFPSSSGKIPSSSSSSYGQKKQTVSANLFLDLEPLSLFNTTPRNMTYFLQQVEPLAHFYSYAVKEMIRDGKHPLTLAYILGVYWLLWWDIRFIWFLPQLILGGWCFRCYHLSRKRSASSLSSSGTLERRLSQHSLPSPRSISSNSLDSSLPLRQQQYTPYQILKESFCFKVLSSNNTGGPSSLLDQFWIKGPGSMLDSEVAFGSVSKEWHSRITEELGRPDNGSLRGNRDRGSNTTVDLDAILLLLQMGQNAMGLAALFLDQSYQVLDALDWTIPLQTMAKLVDLVVSLIPAFLGFKYISFRLLFFVIGMSPVFALTYKQLYTRIPIIGLVYSAWGYLARLWFFRLKLGESVRQCKRPIVLSKTHDEQGISEAFILFSSGGDRLYRVIEIYENQRWWLGLSWQPHLFTSERPLYSNEKGDIYCPFEAFEDSCRGWKRVDWDDMQNVLHPELGDEDDISLENETIPSEMIKRYRYYYTEPSGDWEYGETDWTNLQKYASPLSVVRRRKLRIAYEMDWSSISITEFMFISNLIKDCFPLLTMDNKPKVD